MKKKFLFLSIIISVITFSCKEKDPEIEAPCDPPNPPTATNNSPVSIGETLTLTAQEISGASYQWRGPNNFSSTQRVVSISFSQKNAGVYTVTATVNGCTSEAYETIVTSCAGVDGSGSSDGTNYSGSVNIAENGTLSLKVDFIPGTVYYWSGPNFNDTLSTSTVITRSNVDTTMAGTYYVYAKVDDCSSPMDSVKVVVFPAAPIVSSNIPKVGDTLKLNITNPKVNTFYKWVAPDASFYEGMNLTSLEFKPAARSMKGNWLVVATRKSDNLQSATTIKTVDIAFSGKNCGTDTQIEFPAGKLLPIMSYGNQCWFNGRYTSADTLMSWKAAMAGSAIELQGYCPKGWHVPTEAEWDELLGFVNFDGKVLMSTKDGGTDNYGFKAYAIVNGSGLNLITAKDVANTEHKYAPDFWTSDSFDESGAWTKKFNESSSNVTRNIVTKTYEAQLRCIRD